MTTSDPRVSVVIPARNARISLERCLQSIRDQTLPQHCYEVIVVDDCSRDATAQVARKFGARVVILDQQSGSYSARNHGAHAALGAILAFTDADCIAEARWLEEGLRSFEDPRIGGVAGAIRGWGAGLTLVERHQLKRQKLSENVTMNHSFLPYAQTANAFYRHKVWRDLKGFPDGWISGGDADFAWRMQLETGFQLAASPNALVRHHHRTTVVSFCLQAYRHGIGEAALWHRYRPALKGFSASGLIISVARAAGGLVLGLLEPGTLWARIEASAGGLLDVIQVLSREAGLLVGSLVPARTVLRTN